MEDLPFDDLVELIRQSCGIPAHKRITRETRFERDLGVTGDDGVELLEAVEKRFGVNFTSESFALKPNEYLFGPEASFPGLPDLISFLRRRPEPIFRSFTVGELHEVTWKEIQKTRGSRLESK